MLFAVCIIDAKVHTFFVTTKYFYDFFAWK